MRISSLQDFAFMDENEIRPYLIKTPIGTDFMYVCRHFPLVTIQNFIKLQDPLSQAKQSKAKQRATRDISFDLTL